ncbi:hypothetical protein [Nocardioides sp. YIM 152315]|uniref:hypothetical protein n=1 Tax=Nocardioides sp. YIM 152315 TaxID=3031760 RepID=UPI0023DC8446|nr:hypothetical protein [Nocardioides sp. YIM 152315]MDF1603402.1 hypothetical protein [Nocardioides sp. YIM 152315]
MSAKEEARGAVSAMLWSGLGLLLVGLAIATATWPHVDLSGDRGSWVLSACGLGTAAVGQTLVLVAVIAYGVRYGLAMVGSRETPTPTRSTPVRQRKSLSDVEPLGDA